MKRFVILLSSLALLSGACRWQPYIANRTFRQLTGQKVRFHPVTPLREDLRHYTALEVHRLDNLMLDQMPPDLERYLNDKIFEEVRSLKLFRQVLPPDQEVIRRPGTGEPTLVLEGQIDDFHPGYLGLRVLELGYNHMSTTVRFQLRDKQTEAVLGSASVTIHENRPTGTQKSVANRIAKQIKKFIASAAREHRG